MKRRCLNRSGDESAAEPGHSEARPSLLSVFLLFDRFLHYEIVSSVLVISLLSDAPSRSFDDPSPSLYRSIVFARAPSSSLPPSPLPALLVLAPLL
jgi:hypothetical protein